MKNHITYFTGYGIKTVISKTFPLFHSSFRNALDKTAQVSCVITCLNGYVITVITKWFNNKFLYLRCIMVMRTCSLSGEENEFNFFWLNWIKILRQNIYRLSSFFPKNINLNWLHQQKCENSFESTNKNKTNNRLPRWLCTKVIS